MRAGTKRFWTGREQVIMREYYPREGLPGCVSRLPGRTATSIYQRARILGLKAPSAPAEPHQRYAHSPATDDDIRRIYADGITRDALKLATRRLGRPRKWITNRAAALGLSSPRFKTPQWTADEDAILSAAPHFNPKTLARRLTAQGFSRSPIAIHVRLTRLGLSRIDPDKMCARELAEIMGTDGKTVARWIEKGWLKAKVSEGGIYRISRKQVRSFIVDNVAAVNIGRCDKFWLVDLLAGILE